MAPLGTILAYTESYVCIMLIQLLVELLKSAPSGSHSYIFMLITVALFVGEGAKCPNDSFGSLKSSFSVRP